MKKKSWLKLYWLIVVVWAIVALLVWTDSQAGIYNNSGTSSEDSICFAGVNASANGRRLLPISTSDSLYVLCYYPGGALAFRDSLQMNSSKVTISAFEDEARVGGFTYKNAIADIDGGGQNGNYKFIYSLIDIDSNNVSWGISEGQVYATANISTVLDKANNLVFTVTNQLDANVLSWNSSTVTTPVVAGSPVVTLGVRGSDADTGIAGLKTKQTTIAGYTDDIGVAGAGLTAVRLGVRGLESDTSFATTKAKIYSLSAGSGVTLAQLDSVLDLFVSGDSLVTLIWNAAARTLTALDEDATTLDLNGTTIGTVSIVTMLNGIANNVITAASIADGAIDSATYASSAKTGLAFYVWNSSSRTLTVASADTTAILSMLTNNKFFQMPYDSFTVTAVGASATSMFVTNRLSATASGYYTERLLVWSKLAGASANIPSSVTRFVDNGSSDTMSICNPLPASIAVGDQGRIYTLAWPCFATLAEANDSAVAALLGADTTGHGAPGTVGEALIRVILADTSATKTMLENMGLKAGLDSLAKLAQTSTGAGGVRRGEVASKAQIVDSTKVTPLIIGTNNDKTGYALSASGIDAIWDEPKAGHTTSGTYGYYVDAAISGVSGGGGSCAGTGSDTTDIFVFAASDSDQFVGVWVTYYVGAERLVAQTDSTGRARFATDGSGSYTAIVSARPFTHDNAYVVEGAVDTIWMEASENAPTLTPVCGTLRNLQGQPIAGAVVTATNQASNIRIDGYTVSRYVVNVTTDQFGRFTLWLYPTAVLGGTSYKYNFTAYRGSTLIESVTSITVPDQATCYEIDWTIN